MENNIIDLAYNVGVGDWVKKIENYLKTKKLPSSLVYLTGELMNMETEEGSDYWREKYEAVCRFTCVSSWPSNYFVVMDNKTKDYVKISRKYNSRDMEIFSAYYHDTESVFALENIFKYAISAVHPPIKTKDMIDIVTANSIIDPKDISEGVFREEYYYTISGFFLRNYYLQNPNPTPASEKKRDEYEKKLERFTIDLLDETKRHCWTPLFQKNRLPVDQLLDGVILLDNLRREYTFINPDSKHRDIALELFSFHSTPETTVLDFPE